MKHLKMLGLTAMAAAALMASAGSASAATLTAPAGTAYFGSYDWSLEFSTLLKAGFAEITCTVDHIEGSVTFNNETEAGAVITTAGPSLCGSATVKTLNPNGTLSIAHGTHAVSGTGTEVTVSLSGIDCVYGMGVGTNLGTASNTARGVTLAVKARLNKVSGSFLCASPAEWTANYILTSPTGSVVD